MVLQGKTDIRRLGIFFFYDKDGIVDPYVGALLDGMRPHLAELLVVSNGILTIEGEEYLRQHSDALLMRDNTGFDVGAYKDGMAQYGWDALAEYDELILFNFTVFGPLYPFAETFNKMDAKDLDFWGLTMHNGDRVAPWYKPPSEDDEDGKPHKVPVLPVHLQSHFIAVRKSLLQNARFQQYWDKMPAIRSYEDSIQHHEAAFTEYFSKRGFKWEASVDTTDITHDVATFPLVMMPLDLIKNRRCPIIKRRSFFRDMRDTLHNSMGEVTIHAFEYIKQHTSYDTELIWQNILRSCNQADIKNALQLNYVLASAPVPPLVQAPPPKVALLMHIYYFDLIETCYRYAQSMPEYADIYVTTDSEEKKKQIEETFVGLACNRLEVRLVSNRGRDVGALLVGLRDVVDSYDLLCFAHDKKGSCEPRVAGDSFAFLDFEGILHSSGYVHNIISLFQQNPRMGLLTPPPPAHSSYFSIFGHEWSTNYEGCVELADILGLNVDMDPEKQPVSPLGSEFWFRPQALKPLFDYGFAYEDFPDDNYYRNPKTAQREHISHQIERIHSFVAQHQGYYPAWVMPENIAAMEITMLNYYARELNRAWPYGKKPVGLPLYYQLEDMARVKKTFAQYDKYISSLRKALRENAIALRHNWSLLANSRKDNLWLQEHNGNLEKALGESQLKNSQLQDINRSLEQHIQQLEGQSLLQKIKRHFTKR